MFRLLYFMIKPIFSLSLSFVTELALFHSLAQSYANKFKRINKRLINMPTHLPWAAK